MKKDYTQFIDDHIISCDVSYRGGTLKVDVSELFPRVSEQCDDVIMGAYQNYLGGGIAGAIVGASMFDPGELNKAETKLFEEVKEAIKVYYFNINNGGGDDYMQENHPGYEANQRRSVSAY